MQWRSPSFRPKQAVVPSSNRRAGPTKSPAARQPAGRPRHDQLTVARSHHHQQSGAEHLPRETWAVEYRNSVLYALLVTRIYSITGSNTLCLNILRSIFATRYIHIRVILKLTKKKENMMENLWYIVLLFLKYILYSSYLSYIHSTILMDSVN